MANNVVSDESIMVDAREAAALCGTGRTTWLELNSAGKVPAPRRLGRRVLWLRDEIIAWCKAGCPNHDHWKKSRGQ